MSQTISATAGAKDHAVDANKFPPGISYIVGNEACERYSYYGMKSILVIFMIQVLLFQEAQATSTYHLFSAACYLLPVAGAFIADRILGKYRTILYLSLVYCLGHAVLSIWETEMGLYAGLGLIAVGSGGIKPCVSAHVGDQFKANQQHLLKKVYEIFYFMINFGSFFSTLITPWTLKAYGPSVAFGIPGVLMFIATFIFWMGRNKFVHVPPTKSDGHGFMNVIMSAFKNQKNRKAGQTFMDAAVHDGHTQDHVDGAKAVLDIAKLFSAISVFWALFDQHGSSWVIQASKMNLVFMGIKFEASQISAWNPIMVMGLIPLFSMGIYPFFDKMGLKTTPIRRITCGMFVAAGAFAIIAMIQMAMDGGSDMNVMWQFWPYLVLTMAEVMVSITGLEFAYTQSPRAMKSTVMSLWLLTVFFGNLITAYVAAAGESMFPVASAGYFWFFAGLMAVFAVVFWFMGKQYKMKNYMEK
jgi:POT family proton-dependent oligopeptide transporter